MATVKLALEVELPGTDPSDLEDVRMRLEDAASDLRVAFDGSDEDDAGRLLAALEEAIDALDVSTSAEGG